MSEDFLNFSGKKVLKIKVANRRENNSTALPLWGSKTSVNLSRIRFDDILPLVENCVASNRCSLVAISPGVIIPKSLALLDSKYK